MDFQYVPAEGVVPVFEELLGRLRERGGPFFLWLHFMDPHVPYHPRGGEVERRVKHPLAYADVEALADADPDDAAALLARVYDSEVLHADRHMGQVLDLLDEGGLLERTLVVLTSDHGEELLERRGPSSSYDTRGFGHGHTMYEELVRIPLILRFPERRHAGRRIAAVAQHVDLLPTLLSFAGVPSQSDAHFEGVDLLPLVQDAAPPAGRYAVSELNLYGPELKQIRSPGHKLILRTEEQVAEFYDLGADPDETRNLAGRTPRYFELASALRDWMEERSQRAPAVAVGEAGGGTEVQEPLRALGYVE